MCFSHCVLCIYVILYSCKFLHINHVNLCLCETFTKLVSTVCAVLLSGGSVSLKVHYEKMREMRRRQEMNEGVEMET